MPCQETNVITWGASAAACARSRQWAQVQALGCWPQKQKNLGERPGNHSEMFCAKQCETRFFFFTPKQDVMMIGSLLWLQR